MGKEGNMTLLKVHISLATDSKDTEVDEMSDKQFKIMIFKSSMDSKKIQKSEQTKEDNTGYE
jgi:hypothetical protein